MQELEEAAAVEAVRRPSAHAREGAAFIMPSLVRNHAFSGSRLLVCFYELVNAPTPEPE